MRSTVFCVALCLAGCAGLSDAQRPEDAILAKIFENYNKHSRPKGTNSSDPDYNGPVQVRTNLMIRSLGDIDVAKMQFDAQLTFREEWTDARLGFEMGERREGADFIVVPDVERAWRPDTFFTNEKRAHRHAIDTPNVLMRVYPDGRVLYSVRLSLTLACVVSLRNFPFDTHNCPIQFASYAYTNKDIVYSWKEGRSIQIKDEVAESMPSFELVEYTAEDATSVTNTGVYSSKAVSLHLERRIFYYMLNLFIPSFLLVVISWVSFFLDKGAVPARVTLGVTTILTMITQANGVSAKLPPVAYVKAVDVWIGTCLLFIFAALLEYALITFVGERGSEKEIKNKAPKTLSLEKSLEAEGMGLSNPLLVTPAKESKEKEKETKDTPKTIDVLCRFVFPVLFVLFNFFFWARYSVRWE